MGDKDTKWVSLTKTPHARPSHIPHGALLKNIKVIKEYNNPDTGNKEEEVILRATRIVMDKFGD